MPPAPAAPNPDLLRRIPLSARVVLDVGCKQGALGAALRRINPSVCLLGLEADEQAAEIARSVMDEVAVVDIETAPLPFELPGGIDCIIYGDTLQGFRNPGNVLRRHAEWLNLDGVVLISVPNLEHWSFTDRLLRGTWSYEPSGLLDIGHLRWFTRETMRQLLRESGLSVCDVSPRVFDADAARQFAERLAPALGLLGVQTEGYLQRATPLQYVWRATKTPRQSLVVAGSMLKPVGGVSHVRVIHPFQALETDPAVTTKVLSGVTEVQDDANPRIFVLHRPSLAGPSGQGILRALLSNGWVVVTEFDDNPDFLTAMQDPAQLAFRGVHAVQTSTPALANVLRPRNPEISIFPNAITVLPEVSNFRDPETLTLFFGALNREEDWRALIPVLNVVARRAQERLRFCVVHDRGFFNALETSHKTFMPTCDYDTYMHLLGHSEISLMPLGDNGFNRSKSDLKFIEAGACGVAALASSVVYGDSIVDGETGLIFREPEQLGEQLLALLADSERARRIGEQAREYVARERMLAYQVRRRIAWYRSLWARREELTAALRHRLAQGSAADVQLREFAASL